MEKKIIPVVSLVLRVLIGGLFVYAGLNKAFHPNGFARDIENYRILPHAVAVALSLYLPYLEILCGLAIVFRKLYYGALSLVALMMVVFTGALIAAWAQGLNISCGCFGTQSGKPNYPLTLLRDVAIFAGVGVLLWWANRERRLTTVSG
jgi:uncharacterized membrane protein YphA (DoxX/SURF4 family)